MSANPPKTTTLDLPMLTAVCPLQVIANFRLMLLVEWAENRDYSGKESGIPAGGGAFTPEVGGVGPHPVHLLRLQLLHPSPRILAPSSRLRLVSEKA